MTYQITCKVKTINANVFMQQSIVDNIVVMDIPLELVERMTREIIPKAKRILGKNRTVIELSSIYL